MTGTKILHLRGFQTHSHAHSSWESTEGNFKPREKSVGTLCFSRCETSNILPLSYWWICNVAQGIDNVWEWWIQHHLFFGNGKYTQRRSSSFTLQVYPESVQIVADTDQKNKWSPVKHLLKYDVLVIYMLYSTFKKSHSFGIVWKYMNMERFIFLNTCAAICLQSDAFKMTLMYSHNLCINIQN